MKLNIKLIETEMERQGINRGQLAEKINCTKQAISWIFINKSTTFNKLDKIAKALNRSPKDLLI